MTATVSPNRQPGAAAPAPLSVGAGSVAAVLFGLIALGWAVGALVTSAPASGWVLHTVDLPVRRLMAAHQTPSAADIMTVITNLGRDRAVIAVGAAAAVALGARWRRWEPAGGIAAAYTGAAVISATVKVLVDRTGPPARLIVTGHGGYAWPSGNAMNALAVYGAIAVLAARTPAPRAVRAAAAGLFGALAFAVPVSRVYLGVHWTTDVVASAVLAPLWLLAGVGLGPGGWQQQLTRPVRWGLGTLARLGRRQWVRRAARLGVAGGALGALTAAAMLLTPMTDGTATAGCGGTAAETVIGLGPSQEHQPPAVRDACAADAREQLRAAAGLLVAAAGCLLACGPLAVGPPARRRRPPRAHPAAVSG